VAEPRRPYYVSFTIERIPASVDHSRSNPGPARKGPDRAGHTSIFLDSGGGPQFVPLTGPPRRDGMVPFHYRSINVRFSLHTFVVAISSDYPVGSCPYDATKRHEFEAHLYHPIRIFWRHRDPLIATLNKIAVPTDSAQRWVPTADVPALRVGFENQVNEAVFKAFQNLKLALKTASAIDDDVEHYRPVYNQCPPAQWSQKR